MDFPNLEANLARIREQIAEAQSGSGATGHVTIVAVTKGFPVAAIRAAARAGLTDIGENRVREALEKFESAGDVAVRWHMIGHLQTNKAKKIPGVFGMVHSVDSLRLAKAIDREVAGKKEEVGAGNPGYRSAEASVDVLLQVSLAGEQQKSGCSSEEAVDLAHAISAFGSLRLVGLMTMAPLTGDEKLIRGVFARARKLQQQLNRDLDMPVLSMGMSGDFKLAVQEGATMVRVGTGLFGGRPK